MNTIILGIESSCDDTAAAVIKGGKVLSNIVVDQSVHKEYGGIVPELASRAHQQNIIPVVHKALKTAKVSKEKINAIAFTRGPGLIGSLLVGGCFAKAFALSLDIPIIEINHMQAHILAHFIQEPKPDFPFLCLTVSGGHTQIVKVDDHLAMQVIGESLDDAAGEAFDKSAKILGFDYPGGPLIDQYAQQGNPLAFPFPEPNMPGLNFSFSGLKTAILYFIRDKTKENPSFIKDNLHDICASIQRRIVTILMNKLISASEQTGIQTIAIAGGVSANSGLRKALQTAGEKRAWQVFLPKLEYCTDNAAMIAITAYYKYLNNSFSTQDITPLARWPIN